LVKPPISAAAILPPPMNASLRMLFIPIPFAYLVPELTGAE
jgi:hypothetical protein